MASKVQGTCKIMQFSAADREEQKNKLQENVSQVYLKK